MTLHKILISYGYFMGQYINKIIKEGNRLIYGLLKYINMTHVNFLAHKPLVSETQTDRQDKFVIDIYVYIYIYIFIYIYILMAWQSHRGDQNVQRN